MRLVRMRRKGKLINGDERAAAELGEVSRKTCWTGQFCFSAGMLVVMADGSKKPSELVKVGDLVIDNSGDTTMKRFFFSIQVLILAASAFLGFGGSARAGEGLSGLND